MGSKLDNFSFWTVAAASTCIKFLLIPAYKSTDFDVHRNWLAITHSLPVSKWYYEATSKWTLDYPPFFAWFEYALSHVARYFDARMLRVTPDDYSSEETVLFQRLSVIFADLLYIYATKECCQIVARFTKKSRPRDPWFDPAIVAAMLLLFNPGLFIVDHIHFQYNGFLYGFLLLSVVRLFQNRELEGAFWFAVLLNFKHIYLYVAPAYFVYLLRAYCFTSVKGSMLQKEFRIMPFMKLVAVVSSVFLLSFGPFIFMGQLRQVLTRLFPFKRGLTHAYWAPNVWALYNLVEKAGTFVGIKMNVLQQNLNATASLTGGLVQEFEYNVLPSVTPVVTLLFTLLSVLPALWVLWSKPNIWVFVRCLIICAWGSFLFGWHTHEKAILMVVVPLAILAVVQWKDAQLYSFLCPVAHFSLFPLLHQEAETPVKIIMLLMHGVYAFNVLSKLHRWNKSGTIFPMLSCWESVYLLGLVPLQLYYSIGHSALFGLDKTLPFLPLMLVSTYCAVGVIGAFVRFYTELLDASHVDYQIFARKIS